MGTRRIVLVLVLVGVTPVWATPPSPRGIPSSAVYLGENAGRELWYHRSGAAWFLPRKDLDGHLGAGAWAVKRMLPRGWAVMSWHGPSSPETVQWVAERIFVREAFQAARNVFDTSCNCAATDPRRTGNARQLSEMFPAKRFIGLQRGLASWWRVIGYLDVLKLRGETGDGQRVHPRAILREYIGGRALARVDPRELFPANAAFQRPDGTYSFGRSGRIPATRGWPGMEWGAPHPLSYLPEGDAILDLASDPEAHAGPKVGRFARVGHARIPHTPSMTALLMGIDFALHTREEGLVPAAAGFAVGLGTGQALTSLSRMTVAGLTRAGFTGAASVVSRALPVVGWAFLVADGMLMLDNWRAGGEPVTWGDVWNYYAGNMDAASAGPPPAADQTAYYD